MARICDQCEKRLGPDELPYAYKVTREAGIYYDKEARVQKISSGFKGEFCSIACIRRWAEG